MITAKELLLKDTLSKIINELNLSRDIDIVKDKVEKEFISRNLSPTRATFVLNGNLDPHTLTDSEEDIRFLFLLTLCLGKALEDIKLDVNEFFTKLEVEQWTDFKLEKQEDSIYPIVFKDVQQLSERIWQLKLSAQELHQLSIANALIYNFRTQRNPKITVYGEKINIDVQKVKEISSRLLAGKQFPDQIRLNVLNTGEVHPIYSDRYKTLTLNEGCVINIFDGYHRKTANDLAINENPNLDFSWSILVTHFSEQDAHDFMTQIDKQKPIKKEYIQQMDYSKDENLVVDIIMDSRLSDLAQVTKDNDDYIKFKKGLTKKSILATAIAEHYADQIKTGFGKKEVANWIIEFTNYLMGYYSDEFVSNPYEHQKTNLINNKNMFAGYIALSAKLQNNPDWQKILKEKIESIDFSLENPEWKRIGINPTKDSNKRTRKKLYEYLTEGV